MKKFAFTVDFVCGDDDGFSIGQARHALETAAHGLGNHRAIMFDGETDMSEHGMKVWAKRCAGISLAAPKPVKVKKEKVAAPELEEPATA